MKKLILITFLISFENFAQIGIFEKAEDIGNPKIKGSSMYDKASQTYTLKGGGENIWFNHDEFQFLYKKMKGDFLLTANFQLIGNEAGNGHRKTGWMIRESNQHDAVSINSCIHGDGLAVLQWRLMRGAYMRDPEEEIFFPKEYFNESIVELERIGKKITMRLAKPGEPFEEMGSITLADLKNEVLVGLYVIAHDTTNIQEVKIWNVRISTPVASDWNPNAHLKSPSQIGIITATKLETVDISNGKRLVLNESEKQLSEQSYSADYKSINFKKEENKASLVSDFTAFVDLKKTNKKSKIESLPSFQYFSVYKNGSNQIWRKLPNESGLEQITFELGHAREPQLSPDGKTLAYLVYPHDSNPKVSTSFQRMQLKVISLAGGSPKTVAYFFGGKGSLLANCWSGDSKNVLFSSR